MVEVGGLRHIQRAKSRQLVPGAKGQTGKSIVEPPGASAWHCMRGDGKVPEEGQRCPPLALGLAEGARVLSITSSRCRAGMSAGGNACAGAARVGFAIAFLWLLAASHWIVTDTVVPWDAKNQFY